LIVYVSFNLVFWDCIDFIYQCGIKSIQLHMLVLILYCGPHSFATGQHMLLFWRFVINCDKLCQVVINCDRLCQLLTVCDIFSHYPVTFCDSSWSWTLNFCHILSHFVTSCQWPTQFIRSHHKTSEYPHVLSQIIIFF
jgi:hypothetical protein